MLGAMTGTFRIREIAAQAGLSEATVDRVLHRRGGVRASTVEEVHQAIADLERQRSQLRIAGRTFMADVVVQAPARFSMAVRTALEAELPGLLVVRGGSSFRGDPPLSPIMSAVRPPRKAENPSK